MVRKLKKEDIVLRNKGSQLKHTIIEQYGSIEDFYNKIETTLSLKTLRNGLSDNATHSHTLKCLLTKTLNVNYEDLILSNEGQIKKYVNDIFDNISCYTEPMDYETMVKLFELCKENELNRESLLMERNIARNLYYTDKMDKSIELYKNLSLRIEDINLKITIHSELADLLSKERKAIEAERHFHQVESYIKRNKDIDKKSLYKFYYYRGIFLNKCGYHSSSRTCFEDALPHATIDNEVYSETGTIYLNIGLSLKLEKRYDEAVNYYCRSLFYFSEKDIKGRSHALNNIANIYMCQGKYESALNYIRQALELIKDSSYSIKYLICAQTYIEVEVLIKENISCEVYFEALKKTVNTSIDKNSIKNSITTVINVIRNMDTLIELEEVIYHLKDNTKNHEYIEDLYSCLGRINEKIKPRKEKRNEKN